MTEEKLNAIKERVKKATPGPWVSEETEEGHIDILSPNEYYTICQMQNENYDCLNDSDTEFIKHAITDVPALIAEVERLQTELAKTKECYEIIEKATFKVTDKMTQFKNALEKVMEAEEPIMEGWETSVYKIARETLGCEVE